MAIARFSLSAIDCPDPMELAGFYAAITGWEIETPTYLDDDGAPIWVQLHSQEGATLAFQRIEDFVPPIWPGSERPARVHFDFDVPDLDTGEREVLAIGATKSDTQPYPDGFRVFLDPVGHPFCLVLDD